jgi:hypothetical protein
VNEPTALAFSAAWQFQRRARIYAGVDARLHSKTRFFGAACATNHVLGHLASLRGAIACTKGCTDWLSALGASLETTNLSIADAVNSGRLTGRALDERIVSTEQSIVERSLQDARRSRLTAYQQLLLELDALLNQQRWLSSLHFSPVVRWYSRVLAGVRFELKSPIEFARQIHRETVGMALISALHRK